MASLISVVLILLPTLEGISSQLSLQSYSVSSVLCSAVFYYVLVSVVLWFFWHCSYHVKLPAAESFIDCKNWWSLVVKLKEIFTFAVVYERQFCFYIICKVELSVS